MWARVGGRRGGREDDDSYFSAEEGEQVDGAVADVYYWWSGLTVGFGHES